MRTPISKLGAVAGVMREMISGQRATTQSPAYRGNTNLGSYQTAPLTDYRSEHRNLAERIFRAAAAQLRPALVHSYKGSYSFFGDHRKETVAKIIIFEQGVGRVHHDWPIERDGVYVLLRVHGETDKPTVGIAPRHAERFTYQCIGAADADAVVQKIVAAVRPLTRSD